MSRITDKTFNCRTCTIPLTKSEVLGEDERNYKVRKDAALSIKRNNHTRIAACEVCNTTVGTISHDNQTIILQKDKVFRVTYVRN